MNKILIIGGIAISVYYIFSISNYFLHPGSDIVHAKALLLNFFLTPASVFLLCIGPVVARNITKVPLVGAIPGMIFVLCILGLVGALAFSVLGKNGAFWLMPYFLPIFYRVVSVPAKEDVNPLTPELGGIILLYFFSFFIAFIIQKFFTFTTQEAYFSSAMPHFKDGLYYILLASVFAVLYQIPPIIQAVRTLLKT